MKTLIPKLVGALINCIGFFNASYASKLALKLFSKPRSGQLTSSANLFLESANKKTLFYNDTPIQTYHWKGDKETLLLAHGWESNTSRWRHKIETLHKEGYSIYALDGPAHGASGSDTFNAILYSEFINVVSQDILTCCNMKTPSRIFVRVPMPLTNEERNYLKLLGGNIVKKRKERGIKQKELSDLLDIDDGSLRRIESGRTNPTTMSLYNIASALEIELKDLFDFENDLN